MDKIKLTEKDNKILEVIKRSPIGYSPTELGLKLGQSYNTASSYCSASLKRLKEAGLIVKLTLDGKVKYKLKVTNISNK